MRTFTIYNLENQKPLLTVRAKRVYIAEGGIVQFYDADEALMGVTQITPSTVIYDAEEKLATVLELVSTKDTCTKQV